METEKKNQKKYYNSFWQIPILKQLDKLSDPEDIIKFLDSNGQVSDAIIKAAVNNNALPTSYAASITQSAINAGIVNSTASLAQQRLISATTSGMVTNGNATQYGNIYNFESLVLPNVTNASQFINELNNLNTIALQSSTQRK